MQNLRLTPELHYQDIKNLRCKPKGASNCRKFRMIKVEKSLEDAYP